MRSMDYFSQALLAPLALQWIQVAVVACLFLAALYRSEKILRPGLFLLALFFITLAIVLPSLTQFALAVTSAVPSPTRSFGNNAGAGWLPIVLPLNGLFVGAAVFCGLLSVAPSRVPSRPATPETPPAPRPHPLDD